MTRQVYNACRFVNAEKPQYDVVLMKSKTCFRRGTVTTVRPTSIQLLRLNSRQTSLLILIIFMRNLTVFILRTFTQNQTKIIKQRTAKLKHR